MLVYTSTPLDLGANIVLLYICLITLLSFWNTFFTTLVLNFVIPDSILASVALFQRSRRRC